MFFPKQSKGLFTYIYICFLLLLFVNVSSGCCTWFVLCFACQRKVIFPKFLRSFKVSWESQRPMALRLSETFFLLKKGTLTQSSSIIKKKQKENANLLKPIHQLLMVARAIISLRQL